VVGVTEMVEDGVTGVVVPPEDAPALAKAVIGLLEDPDRATAMGRAGRRRVAAGFSLEGMLARMEAIYWEVAAAHPRAGGGASPEKASAAGRGAPGRAGPEAR